MVVAFTLLGDTYILVQTKLLMLDVTPTDLIEFASDQFVVCVNTNGASLNLGYVEG